MPSNGRNALGQLTSSMSNEERFWRLVDRRGDDECWLWTGGKMKLGHGVFWLNGTSGKAHRFSYEIHIGPIPTGMFICHRCDTPACVNPKHLFAGTALDNNRDCIAKGRHSRGASHAKALANTVRRGESNRMAKLTESKVLEMRAMHAAGANFAEVARAFSVSHATATRVCRGQQWAHVGNPQPEVRSPPFFWTASDKARVVPGSTVECHCFDRDRRRVVTGVDKAAGWLWLGQCGYKIDQCDPQSLIAPAKPAPTEPDADGTLHDRIGPASGRLLSASPVFADADRMHRVMGEMQRELDDARAERDQLKAVVEAVKAVRSFYERFERYAVFKCEHVLQRINAALNAATLPNRGDQ